MKKILIAIPLLASLAAGGFLQSLGGFGSNASAMGFDLGKPSLQCDQDFGLDQLLGKMGICGIADKLTGFLDKIGISGCSLGAMKSNKCYNTGLKGMCEDMVKKRLNGVMSPLRDAISSTLELETTKGDAFREKGCAKDSGKTTYPSGETDESIKEKTDIGTMTRRYGTPFTAKIDLTRTCMQTEGEKCLEPGYMKLPKNALEVEKHISEASTQIAASDKSYTWDILVAERALQKQMTQCLKLPTVKATKACEDKLMKGENGPTKLEKKALAELELSAAAELKAVKMATMGDLYYIYKDKKSVERLPLNVIPDYIDGVARQNAADTVFLSLWKENLATKKALIRILFKKMAC